MTLRTVFSHGKAWRISPRPSPTSTTISAKPTTTPVACGNVGRTPNLAPDAISIRLFGPGVKKAGIAAAMKAAKTVASMVALYYVSKTDLISGRSIGSN